ncbi:hypothetical protein SPRG_01594 [Saprolegnia parasitica CBS 223.65]|uniref:DNA repair and recombination protein RAD26 n=1 Tax=Saprolegnia parasitica (strain CBS 223.65) TaxID=695850 RepID=A0A067D4A1_SAPPC|nr:hypothetical protein SPRG_01594 [Saprolegnia parasitica CBS 223.65]KDO33556.1 hypothetical protein SPRG_01594 [Saprolegnia parasitica CBS 223.65]|eukprot:XP_012195353.1 hypothetical protein SPRG_01594 [Saprolegnia parasitica CBS 223.65]
MDLLPSSDDESDGGLPLARSAALQGVIDRPTAQARAAVPSASAPWTPAEKKPMMSVFERLLALNPRASSLPVFQNAAKAAPPPRAEPKAPTTGDPVAAKQESTAPAAVDRATYDMTTRLQSTARPATVRPREPPPAALRPTPPIDSDRDAWTITYPSVPPTPDAESMPVQEVDRRPTYVSPFGLHTTQPVQRHAAAPRTQLITQNALLAALQRAEAAPGPPNGSLSDDDDWLSDAVPMASNTARTKPIGAASAIDVAPKRKSQPTSTTPAPKRRPPSHRPAKLDDDDNNDDNEDDDENTWPKLSPPAGAIDEPLVLLDGPNDMFSRRVQVPGRLNRFLQPYQRDGVSWMFQAVVENRGAILGDEMGLGKTIQVIGLLSALLFKEGTASDKEVYRNRLRSVSRREPLDFDVNTIPPPILIVVPASLLMNWELELKLWMCCRPVILNGKRQDREAVLTSLSRGTHDIVICSYDILKANLPQIQAVPWYLVVLDEMHCLKNPESQATKAVQALFCKRRLGLTGTLMQNDTDELHCLLNTIHEGSEKQLRDCLVPYYLRRDKSIHPDFTRIQKFDKIVFCELTPLQRAVYDRVIASPDFQVLIRGDDLCDCGRKKTRRRCCYVSGGVLWQKHHPDDEACQACPACIQFPCIAQLLKLSNHLDLLRVNPRDPDDVQAATKAFATVAFGKDLDTIGLYQAQGLFEKMNTALCGKMVVLEKLLSIWMRKHEKVLLFSRSVRMLDILQAFLISKACAYVRLDGSTKVDERLALVQRFNRDPTLGVFLISTKAGGLGLNITSATNVVIFDPSWNPAHDCQAQDRAYRIGQTRDVKVFRLITLGTIEEMIYARQIYKQQLTDTTLKGKMGPRYFEAIIGVKGQHGELFGIRNLLQFKPQGVMKAIQDNATLDGIPIADNQVDFSSTPASDWKSAKKKSGDLDDDIEDVAEELELDQEISVLAPQSMNHDVVLGDEPQRRRSLPPTKSSLYTPAYLKPHAE